MNLKTAEKLVQSMTPSRRDIGLIIYGMNRDIARRYRRWDMGAVIILMKRLICA